MQNANARIQRLADQCALRGWRLARTLAGNTHDADDIMQKSFIVAWRKLDRLPHDDPWPWFATVIANEARNLRRKSREQGLESEVAMNLAAPAHDPGKDSTDADLALAVARELSGLDEPEREAIAVIHLAGLSVRDAAAALGVAPSTLQSRVRSGLDRLRVRLKCAEPSLLACLPVLPIDPPPAGMVQSWLSGLSHGATTTAGTTLGKTGGLGMVKAMVAIVAIVAATIGVWQWASKSAPKPEPAISMVESPQNNTPVAANTTNQPPVDEPKAIDAGKVVEPPKVEPKPVDKPPVPTRPKVDPADLAKPFLPDGFKPEEWDSGGELTGVGEPIPARYPDSSNVTVTLAGVTVDSQGNPVPGCRMTGVACLWNQDLRRKGESGWSPAGGGVSDKNGVFRIRFTFPTTKSGKWYVGVTAQDKSRWGKFAGANVADGGEATGLRVVIRDKVAATLRLVDTQGNPLPNVTVALDSLRDTGLPEGATVDRLPGNSDFQRAKSDQDGRVTFEKITTGTYGLAMFTGGLAPQDAVKTYEISASTITPVDLGDIVLAKGIQVGDSMYDEDLNVVAQPFQLTVYDSDNSQVASVRVEIFTGWIFRANLPHLEIGSYRFVIECPGFAAFELPAVTVKDGFARLNGRITLKRQ